MTLRVLHAPHLVGGNPSSIAHAERALGIDSWCASFKQHPFGYPADEVLWRSGDPLLVREYRRWKLFRRALHDFDVLHFNSGQTILSWGAVLAGREKLSALERVALIVSPYVEYLDLAAYKRTGKVIAVTYQGDEARQGDYCRQHFAISIAGHVAPGYYSSWSDARKRQRIAKVARFADLIYSLNPDLLHVLPSGARFLPYANVDLTSWAYVPPRNDAGRPPLVVHAPSHRGVKGTEQVLAALDRLRRDGLAFELRLVEGMHHGEARLLYEQADIVVDQLLAGWYGGLAVEAMALGKPVVAYIRDSDLRFIPDAMRRELPIINADPETIHAVLRQLLLGGRDALANIGRAGRGYVERWHDPRQIAAGLIRDYHAVIAARKQH